MITTRTSSLTILARLAAVLAFATALTGCVGVLLGGAATGAAVVNDPRTTGTVVEDQSIEVKAAGALHNDAELSQQTNVNVTSYNQIVLLTGEAPTEDMRTRIFNLVKAIAKVRKIGRASCRERVYVLV